MCVHVCVCVCVCVCACVCVCVCLQRVHVLNALVANDVKRHENKDCDFSM